MSYERLLSPYAIGAMTLRNRIAMCPMGTNLGEPDGSVGDDAVAWFEARALGGAALVIVGSVAVGYPHGAYDSRQLAASDDRFMSGLQRLAAAVRGHGARIAAQLVHDGTQSLFDIAEGRPLLVPSKRRPPPPDELSTMLTPDELQAVSRPFTRPSARLAYREASEDDIAEVVDWFAVAARKVVDAGFDAIEIHAGHGYLIDAFLSPATNTRTDRWGGDASARAGLLVAVTGAVRAAVGPGVPVWARIGAAEHHRDPGQTITDALVAMRAGIAAGLDAIHVTAYAEPMVATGITDGHTPHRPGALLSLARRVRDELGVPTIAMGRLTPEAADEAIADGTADLVAFGRALIADPDLPAKLAAGRRDRIRPCAYQYRCIGSIFLNDRIRCAVNADAGHEAAAPAVPRAAQRILVVGGGPVGLEAARRLAHAGNAVTLWEARARLGGRLRQAELADPDVLGLADWLAGAAADAGVAIELARTATAGAVAALAPDRVVVATGGDWSAPHGALGLDDLVAWLAGDDDARVGDRLAIVGGGKAALSLAAHAAGRGHRVTVLSSAPVLAPELGLPGRFRLVADCRAMGVTLLAGAADGARHAAIAAADTTVVVQPVGAVPAWTNELAVPVAVVGDATGAIGLDPGLRAAAALVSAPR